MAAVLNKIIWLAVMLVGGVFTLQGVLEVGLPILGLGLIWALFRPYGPVANFLIETDREYGPFSEREVERRRREVAAARTKRQTL